MCSYNIINIMFV